MSIPGWNCRNSNSERDTATTAARFVATRFSWIKPVKSVSHREESAAINTHNPFAVNDIYFCRETGADREKMNQFGSPLIYGHPQAPTGMRAIVELIETLKGSGGGLGLFTGCAAGDTSMAIVLKVTC